MGSWVGLGVSGSAALGQPKQEPHWVGGTEPQALFSRTSDTGGTALALAYRARRSRREAGPPAMAWPSNDELASPRAVAWVPYWGCACNTGP